MKAIILTYAPVIKKEQALLKNTNIFKLALNNHASEYMPHARILTDYILKQIYNKFPEKIISIRDSLNFNDNRIEYPNIKFKGATIIAAIDYLALSNYDEILIVGDNKVNNIKFRNIVNNEIKNFSNNIKLFQYNNGNFDLQVKSITEFCRG